MNLHVPFDEKRPLEALAAERLQISPDAVRQVTLVRKAIDARHYKNSPIQFVYTLDVQADGEKRLLMRAKRDKNIILKENEKTAPLAPGDEPLLERPVTVGFGPAGMLAGWLLAKEGYRPLILERGQDVDTRVKDVREFWRSGTLKEESNIQFGEGGAGTFSDGKLTTRLNDGAMRRILDLFIECGAPPEIGYLHKPHIGTDKLRTVVKNLRRKIIALGGEIRFGAKVENLVLQEGRVRAVVVDGEKIRCGVVLLGIGHSARDTYELLYKKGAAMEAKPFAIGVRIEHPQSWIDCVQYGADAGHPLLPVADYALTYQDRQTRRGVYSFCMCPGGFVVAAASEKGRVATNGMSLYDRASGVANSALLVTVGPEDFERGALGGIAFQRRYEELAFQAGGGDYCAPVQTVGDFLTGGRRGSPALVRPSYLPGVRTADLRRCLPESVASALARALPEFGRKIKGFDDGRAVLTAIESRSSAPCRILRDRVFLESVNIKGLYPMGEGAGYAGGIMSAAADGLHAASAVIRRYKV